MTQPLLEARQLVKYFPVMQGVLRKQVAAVKAVDGIDLVIPEGSTVGLVGESGCGKSTAARCVIRLLEPTSGEVLYKGTNLLALNDQEMKKLRREIQIVFQDPLLSLNPRMTIGESLSEPVRYHGIMKREEEIEGYIAEILEQVGLNPDAMMRYPHQFSGGQLQRICIGRAIALKPKLIICDEAVSALDVSVQGQILNLLGDLQQEFGLTYLFIAHNLSVVRHICDHIVVMYLGKVMESAPAEELFAHPKHPYTRALLSAIPKTHPSKVRTHVPLEGEVPSPIDPPSGCPFRTRCPYAKPKCCETPPVKQRGAHRYHCVLAWDWV